MNEFTKKCFKKKKLRGYTFFNNKGQALLESILIMLIFIALFRATVGILDSQDFVRKVVRGPWVRLDHMVRFGEWTPSETHARRHPNYLDNHLSLQGEKPQ